MLHEGPRDKNQGKKSLGRPRNIYLLSCTGVPAKSPTSDSGACWTPSRAPCLQTSLSLIRDVTFF